MKQSAKKQRKITEKKKYPVLSQVERSSLVEEEGSDDQIDSQGVGQRRDPAQDPMAAYFRQINEEKKGRTKYG